MDKELFVRNIKERCRAKGVKPTVACRESGVGTSFITDVNKGTTPSVAKVQLLAQYLGCTVSDLLGETPAAAPENVKAAAQEGSGLEAEFAKLFQSLSPDKQNEIIAEMLKRQRESKA